MSGLTGAPTIATIDLYSSSSSQGNTELGQLIEGPQGKAFRYVLAGASNLVVGNVLQSKAVDTQFSNMTVASAVAAGATQITVTNGSTVTVADEFKYGSLTIYTAGTIPVAQEYTIVSNTAAAGAAAMTITVDRPFRAAVTTSATVNLRWSPYYKVIQSPATTLTGSCVGVAIYAIPAGEYGWVQTRGVCGALSDGSSILVGSPVAVPSGTAGAVILGATNLMQIGQAMQAAASGKGIAVNLTLD